jgi:hypothetical protein
VIVETSAVTSVALSDDRAQLPRPLRSSYERPFARYCRNDRTTAPASDPQETSSATIKAPGGLMQLACSARHPYWVPRARADVHPNARVADFGSLRGRS